MPKRQFGNQINLQNVQLPSQSQYQTNSKRAIQNEVSTMDTDENNQMQPNKRSRMQTRSSEEKDKSKAVKEEAGLKENNPPTARCGQQQMSHANFKLTVQESKPVKRDPTLTIEKKVRGINLRSKDGNKDQENSAATSDPKAGSSNNKSEAKKPQIMENNDKAVEKIDFSDPKSYYEAPELLPKAIQDFDKDQLQTMEAEPHYAFEIFEFYKRKEIANPVKSYLHIQPELSKRMRAVLVDWLVEVQESFELNHETLYLAVKLIDHFLMRQKIPKSKFQLIGATAVFIASKFDERIPPAIEDFLYICDDAYNREDIIAMEMNILRTLDFCLGFPLSYRFLRRYARCAKLSMETLTLARYILEMSLMEYDLIEEKDSLLAAAALLLALRMKKNNIGWSITLEFYSGYQEAELLSLMNRLNAVISPPFHPNIKTIRNKYSHSIFYEVGKISPLGVITKKRNSGGKGDAKE